MREDQLLSEYETLGNYLNPLDHDNRAQQMPQNIEGFLWDVQARPANWNDARYGEWEEGGYRLLLIPNIRGKTKNGICQ